MTEFVIQNYLTIITYEKNNNTTEKLALIVNVFIEREGGKCVNVNTNINSPYNLRNALTVSVQKYKTASF